MCSRFVHVFLKQIISSFLRKLIWCVWMSSWMYYWNVVFVYFWIAMQVDHVFLCAFAMYISQCMIKRVYNVYMKSFVSMYFIIASRQPSSFYQINQPAFELASTMSQIELWSGLTGMAAILIQVSLKSIPAGPFQVTIHSGNVLLPNKHCLKQCSLSLKAV